VQERAALKARYEAEGCKRKVSDTIGKNWITQFLNRHPVLAAKLARRMDRQRVFASNATIIADHFKKLGKIIQRERFRPHQISNVDEKGIILGYSSMSKVITRRGKKTPYVRQHGKRELVTLVEAVSADGYVFPTFLITKGTVHTYGQFGNIKEEDDEVHFGKSPKGWTDDELALHWLKEIYHPYSLKRIQRGEKRLLILDGHGSHVTLEFSDFCDVHDIVLFCLPAHTTYLLQPLDVGLFSPLQKYYGKFVEYYYLATNVGISHSQFLPIYKKARAKAYTRENIESGFSKTGIVPFNPRLLLDSPSLRRAKASAPDPADPDKTPQTRSELRQPTMEMMKTATPRRMRKHVARLTHELIYEKVQNEVLTNDMQRLRDQTKIAKDTKKDKRVISKARVITGANARSAKESLDKKPQPRRRKTQPAARDTPNALPAVPATPRKTKVRFVSPVETPLRPAIRGPQNRQKATPPPDDWSDSSSDDLTPATPLGLPRPPVVLNTPLAPNRRLPDRPLAVNLISRKK
jgi:hypothetical protein